MSCMGLDLTGCPNRYRATAYAVVAKEDLVGDYILSFAFK